MTKTRALALALACSLAILAACTTSGNRDTASTTTATEATTTSTTEPTETEWTTAMQNACTAEAETLTAAINAFRDGDQNVTLKRIHDMGIVTTTPTYWTVEHSELVGIDPNEDSRCGGIYLP